VLARESFDHLIELEAFRFHLGLHFRHAHLVFGANGDSRVLLAVFEQDQAAV
jgi:hypothetical protein